MVSEVLAEYATPERESIMNNSNVYPFDARGVAKRFRHASIFGALESLADGETMRFVNDHDPLPLLGQIQQRYGNQVGISYVAREPRASALACHRLLINSHRTRSHSMGYVAIL